MKITLPGNVSKIIHILQSNGYEAYAVGGCVRDTILGRSPQDWDITTSALPEQVKALFLRTIDTGIQHGTVTVMMDHVGYEVTTYRIDGEYEDGRHPKEVTFTSHLVEDLKRRDFTINAMAYNEEDGLVDVFDGIGDLDRGIIRCVGDPMERFTEDALRMLRAVRFSAQLGFVIEEQTQTAVRTLAHTIAKVSAERIQVELVKLLLSDHPEEMRTVYHLGLTAVFMPEFDEMMGTEQNTPHHMYTVGEHTIHSLMEIPADKILRLTMLLHDIGKPVCRSTDEDGRDHFHGHPQKGAEMTTDILRRLKFDNDSIRQVRQLVLYHDDRPPLNERNVRRAVSRIGQEYFPQLFEVKGADAVSQSMYQREEKLQYLEEYRRLYEQILAKQQCLTKKDLAINGKDLIGLGIQPGKQLGEILDDLLEHVLDYPEDNDRELLLTKAEELAGIKRIPPS